MCVVLTVAIELGQIGERQCVGPAARLSLLQQMERALKVCRVLLECAISSAMKFTTLMPIWEWYRRCPHGSESGN